MKSVLKKHGIEEEFLKEDSFDIPVEPSGKEHRFLKNRVQHSNDPNLFPADLKIGDMFASSQDFRRFLIEHPMTKTNKDLNQIYRIRVMTKHSKGIGVRAGCNHPGCPARINASPVVRNGKYVVKSMENLHNHDVSAYVHKGAKSKIDSE
jgi:FAD synthase